LITTINDHVRFEVELEECCCNQDGVIAVDDGLPCITMTKKSDFLRPTSFLKELGRPWYSHVEVAVVLLGVPNGCDLSSDLPLPA
jgi:hypothetical protein